MTYRLEVSRNPDPVTNAPGSHPVETGIGAAMGGAATGAAVGTVAGPVGTAIGAAAGAIAGGYAGKGVGELIDPTTEDNWLRTTTLHGPTPSTATLSRASTLPTGMEPKLKPGTKVGLLTIWRPSFERNWHHAKDRTAMKWHDAKEAVRDAYNRSGEIRRSRHTVRAN